MERQTAELDVCEISTRDKYMKKGRPTNEIKYKNPV